MIKTAISSVCIVLLSLLVFVYQTDGFQVFTFESKRRLNISENPQAVVHVEFETNQAQRIDWSVFAGKYIIADFIYTSCETICHSLGFQFYQIQQSASGLIGANQLHLLSVSFDTNNDTPERLDSYIDRFSSEKHSWTAARVNNQNQQAALLKQFGVVAIADDNGGFVHNAALHLISPDGELIQIVDYEDADKLLAYLKDKHKQEGMGENNNALATLTF